MENYKILTADTAIEYVKSKTDIFDQDEQLIAKMFEGDRQSVDGLCNILILIRSTTTNRSVVLKQVLPYVRALKEDGILIPLSLDRINTEVNYIELLDKVMPNGVPKIHLWDEADSIMIMEDLSEMRILRNELINMEKFPELPKQLGAFFGRSAFYTSDLFLSAAEKKALEYIFESTNNGGIFVGLVFDGTFFNHKEREIYHKLQKDVDDLAADKEVIESVLKLKDVFINNKQCLIHTDLHTSNIFVDAQNMKIFDAEYAHYGPASYDVGRVIGSIILNYASLFGLKTVSEEKRTDYQEYLLDMIKEMYQEFESNFDILCHKHYKGDCRSIQLPSMLEETVGFAACVSVSRIFDYGLTFDFKRIEDIDDRARGQRFVIKLSSHLLKNAKLYSSIDEVVEDIREFSLRYIVKDLIEEAIESKFKSV